MARKTKRNRKNPKDKIVTGVVLIVIAVLAFFIFNNSTSNVVNIGTEVPAEWENGLCQAREGFEVGMCCTTWDFEKNEEVIVDCEDLVQVPETQAFFQLDSGNQIAALSSIGFMVSVQNTGNVDTRIRVKEVIVSTVNGDQEGVDKIKTSWDTLKNTDWQNAAQGGNAVFAMSFANRIPLDIPSGASAYQMTDGDYSVTLKLEAEDEQGAVVDAGERTINMHVEQETISFEIDITAG